MYPNSHSFGRRGFTVVELLISLVLGAVIIAVVLQFVGGQTRLATMQSGREEVQQNTRGALEVLASDLRGAVSAGVEVGDANAIEVMLPRRWGVVCSQVGTTQTVAAFPDVPQPTPTGDGAGLLFRPLNTANWRPLLPARATVATAVLVDVTTACAGLSPTGSLVAYRFTGAGHEGVLAGSRVALYERVRYDVRTSRGEQWIHRSNGMSGGTFSMQPLAGPIDAAAGGISFAYYTGTPPVALAAAPGALAPVAGLSQIRLRVRMKSRQGSSPQTEFDSATVQLRN